MGGILTRNRSYNQRGTDRVATPDEFARCTTNGLVIDAQRPVVVARLFDRLYVPLLGTLIQIWRRSGEVLLCSIYGLSACRGVMVTPQL